MTSKEVIDMYEDGELTQGEALEKLSDLAAAGDVQTSLGLLPLMWRKEVELYIFYMYDNDIDSDDYIYIGRDEPDLVLRRRNITALRAWIASKKLTEPFTRGASDA